MFEEEGSGFASSVATSSAIELLHPRVREALRRAGYERLLPVQEKAIPVILRGYHTLIVAPTGSGKTEAALLPVLSMMLSSETRDGLRVVYVTPLRSLNRDVALRIERLARLCGFSVFVRHGDTGQADRKRFLKSPPSIMVTTPETLTLLLSLKDHRSIWSNVGWVIVDEVHELLESERGSELSITLERLSEASSLRVQRIGLSATLSKRSIRDACELLAGGRRVEVVLDSSAKSYDVKVVVVESDDDREYVGKASEKVSELVSNSRSTLVFVNTRHTAELLGSLLAKTMGADSVGVHHGSLSREVREEAEARFRGGEMKALVATSSMELGIDIGLVDQVVQFMSPRQVLVMTQRAGRAGHRFGDTSRAFIITPSNLYEVLESAVIAWRTEKGLIEDVRPHVESLDALAHQIVAMVAEGSAKTVDDIQKVVNKSGLYANTSRETIEEIVSFLRDHKILKVDDSGEISLGRRAMKYLYEVSMIPDEVDYEVFDIVSGSSIGKLSERFVIDKLEAQSPHETGDRFKFVLSGRMWEALEIDLESRRVNARPVAEVEGYLPSWEGELIPVDFKVAREVCSLISIAMDQPERVRELPAYKKLDERVVDEIVRVALETSRTWGTVLSFKNPVIEAIDRTSILYVCLGSKGNFGLALLISGIASKWLALEFNYMPYAIVFNSIAGTTHDVVARALAEAKRMDPAERLAIIQSSLRKSKAFLFRFYHVAKRMGIIDPDARVGGPLVSKLAEAYRDSIAEREALRETIVDKVDLEAINEFLEDLSNPVIVRLKEPSPLARQVLSNPYVRRDVAVSLKAIAMDQIIAAKKRHLSNKRVALLCIGCLHWEELTVSAVGRSHRCPKCGGLALAPLPVTEWGQRAREAFIRFSRGEKLSHDERKMAEEVRERAQLYLNYAGLDLGDYVVMALATLGVGPSRAKRVLAELMSRGERGFFEELLRAEEEYIATRRYWATQQSQQKSDES